MYCQIMSSWEGIQLEKCPNFYIMLFKEEAKLGTKEPALEKEGLFQQDHALNYTGSVALITQSSQFL